jgi:hypothetical protein
VKQRRERNIFFASRWTSCRQVVFPFVFVLAFASLAVTPIFGDWSFRACTSTTNYLRERRRNFDYFQWMLSDKSIDATKITLYSIFLLKCATRSLVDLTTCADEFVFMIRRNACAMYVCAGNGPRGWSHSVKRFLHTRDGSEKARNKRHDERRGSDFCCESERKPSPTDFYLQQARFSFIQSRLTRSWQISLAHMGFVFRNLLYAINSRMSISHRIYV